MLVSRDGKTYDTSDGSEQPHEASAARPQRSEREEINRWEDDGPGPHAHRAAPATDAPRRPAWSVLSPRALLEAVRVLFRRDTPAALGRQERQAELGRAAAERDRERQAAAVANARRDRYRNAWENT